MKYSIIGIIFLAIFSLTSCQKDNSKLGDDQLIDAIQKATNKRSIPLTDMPSESVNVLENEYVESYVDDAKLAPELGYEVEMRNHKGINLGEQSQAYFGLDGRELRRGKDGKGNEDTDDKGKNKCFDLIYPVSFTMPDGTSLSGDTEREVEGALKAWYEAHPDSKEKPILQYPVGITYKDGTIVRIQNEEEMKAAFMECDGEGGGKKRCFEFVFPINFIIGDGIFTVNNVDELKAAKRAWAEAGIRPALQFPVEVILGDRIIEVNSKEEMHRIKEACDKDKNHKRCFVVLFPRTYILGDSEFTVNGKDDHEGWEAIKAWYAVHPDFTGKPTLKFPVAIKWRDGTIERINSQEEMRAAKAKCDEHGDKEMCFVLVYPVTYTMPDGTSLTIEHREGRTALKRWYQAHPDVNERPALQYPVDTKWKDGSIKTLANEEEMRRAKASCD